MTARSRISAALRGHTAIALSCAALLGVFINWTGQVPVGYSAGVNDHSVLSLEGLRWADPTRFVNDWFMQSAPQPHWFFDIVTYLGAISGRLGELYFAYWVVGLVAFGFATALLAKQIVPRHQWLASLLVTVVIAQTPWNVVGSGSTMIAQALPTVVGGQVLYLFLVLLLTGRLRLAAVAAAVVAVFHVQQGAIVIVILVVTIVVDAMRNRRIAWPLVIALGASIVPVVVGLRLRPVAANLSDFVDVCETIIPYHCAAHAWGPLMLLAFTGFIGLSALTVVVFTGRARWFWVTSVGLAAFGLLAGMWADALQLPLFGELAQATNIYRLGVLLLPFTVWGIVLPVLRPLRGRSGVVVGLVWLGLLAAYFLLPGWPIGTARRAAVVLALLVVVVIVTTFLAGRADARREAWMRRAGASTFGAVFVVAALIAGMIVVRPLVIDFVPDPGLRAWGAEVEQIVPPGEVILVPPLSHTVRLVSGRAIVADCKNVPYGGEAWQQWKQRLTDLGGIEQCLAPSLSTFGDFSAEHLDELAAKYGADYLVLDPAHESRVHDVLATLGWRTILDPVHGINAVVVERTGGVGE